MMLSVIIPTCNRNENLGQCLDRLKPGCQTLDALDYEVIVSDDSKDAGAEAFVAESFPWVTYVKGPRRGPAANRNNGARLSQGEWLVFIDDDCLPDAGLLSAYRQAILAHPEVLAFEGAIHPDDWKLFRKDMAECPVNTKGGAFWSANIMVQKQLFMAIGGFDEQFKIAANEDQDLFERLKPATEIIFWQGAKVIHPVRYASLRKRIATIPRDMRNWHRYYRKYHSFIQTEAKAIHSQVMAMLSCLKYGRMKSFVFHMASLVSVVPILLSEEFTS